MLALLTLWLLASPVSCHISHDQKHLQPHAAAYVLGQSKSNSCPSGSQGIATEADCRTAATALTAPWNEASSSSSRPGGCWRGKSGKANWNPDAGAASSDRKLICKEVVAIVGASSAGRSSSSTSKASAPSFTPPAAAPVVESKVKSTMRQRPDTRQSSAHFRREVLVDPRAPTPFATPLPPVPTFATPLPPAAGGTKSGQGGEAVQAAGAVKASQLGAASKATTASASTNAPSPSTSTGENFVEQVGAGETCDIPLTLEECERLAGTLGLTWQRNEDADEQAEGRGRHCVVGREDADAAEGQDAAAAEGGAQVSMKYVRDGSASYPASCYCARSRIPGEGVFLLKHVETGKCLHSESPTAKKGDALVLDTSCDVNDHELMLRKIATGSGAFLLKSVKTGLCASQNGNRLLWGDSCDENDDNLLLRETGVTEDTFAITSETTGETAVPVEKMNDAIEFKSWIKKEAERVQNKTYFEVIMTQAQNVACKDSGLYSHSRCWYLSDLGKTCSDVCQEHGLKFLWRVPPRSDPIAPKLPELGKAKKTNTKKGPMECINADGSSYDEAKSTGSETEDPGNWKHDKCRLVCPCKSNSFAAAVGAGGQDAAVLGNGSAINGSKNSTSKKSDEAAEAGFGYSIFTGVLALIMVVGLIGIGIYMYSSDGKSAEMQKDDIKNKDPFEDDDDDTYIADKIKLPKQKNGGLVFDGDGDDTADQKKKKKKKKKKGSEGDAAQEGSSDEGSEGSSEEVDEEWDDEAAGNPMHKKTFQAYNDGTDRGGRDWRKF